MRLDPRRLLVLHAIAEHGGLTQAAHALGHTRSAVSQQLVRLEQEVGQALVDRSGPRLELTAAGHLLAASGERIERELAATAQRLTSADGRVAGPVTIGASSWVIELLALPTVQSLARSCPEVEPRIVETGLRDGQRQLRRGDLDVLIVSDDRDTAIPLPSGVKAALLVEAKYAVAVPDTWAEPANAAELSGKPWISAPEHSARGRAFARFAAVNGVVPSVEHLAAHPISVSTLLAGRFGAAIMPAYLAEQLPGVRVTGIPVTGFYLTRMLYRAGNARTAPAAEATVRALRRAAMEVAERTADTTPRDVIVRTLHDPSENLDAEVPAPTRSRRA